MIRDIELNAPYGTKHGYYRRLSGEVEARNVQSRMYMTAEERREKLLSETEDVAREDQIFLIQNTIAHSDTALSEVNTQFNNELRQMINGSLPAGHIFQMGRPNAILQSAGIPNLPIEMSSARLEKKSSESYKKKHPFDLESIENLPQALQNPIAIFNNPNNDGKVLLTELKYKGVNHIVALKVKTERGKNEIDFQVNSVATAFPKDRIEEITEWILDKKQGRKAYFNKEKTLAWLSDNGTTLRSKGYDTRDIAKIIKNFQNPQINDEISFHIGAKARLTYEERIRKKLFDDYQNNSELEELWYEFENQAKEEELYDYHYSDYQKRIILEDYMQYHSDGWEYRHEVRAEQERLWQEDGGGYTDLEYMKTPNGVVYGAKLPDGTIYINPKHLNANTPIHEFGHLWEQLMPKRFAKGVELLKNTKAGKDLFQKLKANKGYVNYSDEKLWSETLVTMIGDRGEELFHSSSKSKFVEWVKDFFKALGEMLHKLSNGRIGRELTPNDKLSTFIKGALSDIMSSKEILPESEITDKELVLYCDSKKIIKGRYRFEIEIPAYCRFCNASYISNSVVR